MSVYTKNGDQGTSALMNGRRLPKYDERFHFLGSVDELTSQLGSVKVVADMRLRDNLIRIQQKLMLIMASVADPYNRSYLLEKGETAWLEQEIDRLESSFPRKKEFVLPGGCELSARLDVARTIVRRAERWMASVDRLYHIDPAAMSYMNRLADYLYMEARYADYCVGER